MLSRRHKYNSAKRQRGQGYTWVTGCGEGGYHVAVLDINSEAGDRVVASLGDRAFFLKACVTKPEQVEQAIASVVDRCGSLDAVVNNAGVVGVQKPAVSFLLSDHARYITGHCLPVCAGSLSRYPNSKENQSDPEPLKLTNLNLSYS
eukprot:g37613.t1